MYIKVTEQDLSNIMDSMSMKKTSRSSHGITTVWKMGDDNPLIGKQVKVEWLKKWGGKEIGTKLEGKLVRTFVIRGRTLIGEIETINSNGEKRTISCPWSKNYLTIEEKHGN